MQTSTTKRRAFLIVEDDPLVRYDFAEVVRENGFDVWEAANTAEALSILEASGDAFVGLITDVQMPGTRSGMVLANHARALWPHLRIIVVSGGRRPLAGELPDRVDFFAKPVPAAKLIDALQHS